MPNKYQLEYEDSKGCFWEAKPSKYVTQLINDNFKIEGLLILDLGAGEGKNSVHLANLGAHITAVDISPIALSRFNLQPNYETCKDNLRLITSDIKDVQFSEATFDVIIAYGILHCLDSKQEIFEILQKIKIWLKPNGYFVCASFTDKLPVPEVQQYLNSEAFLSEGELEQKLIGFTIINSENSIITETHPTSKIEHSHSLVRLIAKKDE